MTRYIAGQPIAAPLILPASPWERKPLPVAPEVKPRHRKRRASKYGFDKMAVGDTVTINRGVVDPRMHANRIRTLLARRKNFWPERYTVTAVSGGVKVTRTK